MLRCAKVIMEDNIVLSNCLFVLYVYIRTVYFYCIVCLLMSFYHAFLLLIFVYLCVFYVSCFACCHLA